MIAVDYVFVIYLGLLAFLVVTNAVLSAWYIIRGGDPRDLG